VVAAGLVVAVGTGQWYCQLNRLSSGVSKDDRVVTL
jgi:hypothetical protein